MADETSQDTQIPVHDADGTPSIMKVPAGTPKAQIHAVMRENNLRHYDPSAGQTDQGQAAEAKPGWLGSVWEAAKDEVIDPFLQGASGISEVTTPQGMTAAFQRAREHPVREALHQAGNVGGVVTPILAPEASVGATLAHTGARWAGLGRGGAQTAGAIGGLAGPAARVAYEGMNVPGQLTRLGEEAVGEHQAARATVQARMNNIIQEADARGLELTPQQRADLATQIDRRYVPRGQVPRIDQIETELLDPNRTIRMSDLDRYHTDVRQRLANNPTYPQTEMSRVADSIRDSQRDLLGPHADLAQPWQDSLDQWGREISPSQRVVGRTARNQSTIERRATSDLFAQQERAGQGVPAVNERLRQARDLYRASQASGRGPLTAILPISSAAIGGGGAYLGGERDPAKIALAAASGALTEEAIRRGRVGLATPAGRAAALHYLIVGPSGVSRLASPVQPSALEQLIGTKP
jgi:hypothetical protein